MSAGPLTNASLSYPAVLDEASGAAQRLDALAEQVRALCAQAGFEERAVPESLALSAAWGGAPLHIAPRAWSSAHLPMLRCVRVDGGERVQVFNLVVFAGVELGLPILGCELLCFGRGLHLCVLDAFPLHDAEERCVLRAELRAACALPHLATARKPTPQWGERVFSPDVLLLKPGVGGELSLDEVEPLVLSLTRRFFELYAERAARHVAPPGELERARRLEARRAYLHVHATEEPAGPFLTRIAGAAWVERFVHDLLYPTWLHDADRTPPWAPER